MGLDELTDCKDTKYMHIQTSHITEWPMDAPHILEVRIYYHGKYAPKGPKRNGNVVHTVLSSYYRVYIPYFLQITHSFFPKPATGNWDAPYKHGNTVTAVSTTSASAWQKQK